ncbi:hypothetical protein HKX48_004776 [Thoreauomyces humboldtii]|nr:hypothetical protein HKX48_004776 [Thoreauomyces humboldtii]
MAPFVPASLISRSGRDSGGPSPSHLNTSDPLAGQSSGGPASMPSDDEEGGRARAQALRVLRRYNAARRNNSPRLETNMTAGASASSMADDADMAMDVDGAQPSAASTSSSEPMDVGGTAAPSVPHEHVPADAGNGGQSGRSQFVRSMLETVLSSLNAAGRVPAANGAAAPPAANPSSNPQPPGTGRTMGDTTWLSDLLQTVHARSAAPGGATPAPVSPPAPVPAEPGVSAFFRTLRGRGGGIGAIPAASIITNGRTSVPVLILIGRSARGPTGLATSSTPTPNTNDPSDPPPTPRSPADPEARRRNSTQLFGEFAGASDSASASFAESLVSGSTTGNPASSPSVPASSALPSSGSEPLAGAAAAAAAAVPAESSASPDAAAMVDAAAARRSLQFMIYFIPSVSRPGSPPSATSVPNPSLSSASAQSGPPRPPPPPPTTTAPPPRSSGEAPSPLGEPASVRLPVSDFFMNGRLGGMSQPQSPPPSTFSPNATPQTAPGLSSHATAGPFAGAGPTSADQASPPPAGPVPTQADAPPTVPPRNIVEEFAIHIILQIVSNMLREGSLNGPGGLLGGTLSLDIGDPPLAGAPTEAGETGATNTGFPPGMMGGGMGPGGGMSYEDMLRLANIIGPAVPQHATSADVDRELPVIKFRMPEERQGEDAMDVDGDVTWKTMHTGDVHQQVTEEPVLDGPEGSTGPVQFTMQDLVPATREKCMICLSQYETDEDLRVMKCRHGFHKTCLDQWLVQYHNSCPLCRSKAVAPSTTPAASTDPSSADPAAPGPEAAAAADEPEPHAERRGFLRRVWEMFGSARPTVVSQEPVAPATATDVPDRSLPAAVVVLLS